MSNAIETYLDEFTRRSIAPMCHNMKVYEATLLRQHVNNAAYILNQAQDGQHAEEHWLSQRYKAGVIMTRHFGIHATFCKGTDGTALQAIHCYQDGELGEMIINIPQREVTA